MLVKFKFVKLYWTDLFSYMARISYVKLVKLVMLDQES